MVSEAPIVMDCKLDKIFYGNFMAVRDSHVPIEKNKITGFIGPSGCGKSTVLRSLNRMNDLVKGFRFEGHVHFLGQDVYGKGVDPVVVRRYIGMVFQQPNPFSMSIFDNVAFGLRLNRYKGDLGDRVKHALQGAALWDEVKDRKFDGFIITGAPVETLPFEEVTYWPELKEILDWTETNVHSTMNVCWGGMAAIYHFHKVPKHALKEKAFGVYRHRNLSPASVYLNGFSDDFQVPVSRWTEVRPEDLPADGSLKVLLESEPLSRWLVYSPAPVPEPAHDWLLDARLRGKPSRFAALGNWITGRH